ncbi:hypothetical protein [Paragemmobacter straminiformis]|uniref:Uncharacterized protein n=1 Tax=Paragemmobacter straminiformis TaxID=2045119 RepID=A0A842I6B3_9RHOB|nr:hypothetical protein [Gemmobacter straminiformis]MBC2835155.1 hypothetical protein [Gemmobacter straminiformis]
MHKFKISANARDFLRTFDLGAPEIRLVYALFFVMQRIESNQSINEGETIRAYLSDLRKSALPPERGTRLLRCVIDRLHKTDLFKVLNVTNCSQFIEYQFGDAFIDKIWDVPTRYVVANVKEIRECRTSHEIHFLMLVWGCHKQTYPYFELRADEWGDRSCQKRWKLAAARISKRLGYTLVLCPDIQQFSRTLRRVKVRVMTQGCIWYRKSFYSSSGCTELYEAKDGACRKLTNQQLIERRIGSVFVHDGQEPDEVSLLDGET